MDEVEKKLDELTGSFFTTIENNRLSHAYLFTGGSQDLRLRAVMAVAALLNCENPLARNACGECIQCKKIATMTHPDLYFMEPGDGSIKILEVRTFKRNLNYKKFQGRHRIVIINEAEEMTGEAANCILKVLEEPPDNTVFMLLSSTKGELLPTIISRCQEIYLGCEEDKEMLENFADVAIKLFKGNNIDAFEIIKKIEKEDSMKLFLDNLFKWLRDSIVWQKTGSGELLLNDSWVDSLDECRIDIEKCSYFSDRIIETEKILQTNANKMLALESLVMEIALSD